MFTLETINRGHEQFTGPDFPKLIAYFKELGMVENSADLQNGKVTYRSDQEQVLEKSGYQVQTPVADWTNSEAFRTRLASHQAGQTDFPTFCEDSAQAGIAGWKTDLVAMTCTYYDGKGQAVLVEAIPKV